MILHPKYLIIDYYSHCCVFGWRQCKKEPVSNGLLSGWWQRSIFSGRLQPNIVDVWELNFCVRNGNKWILSAIITIMVHWTLTFISLEQWQLHIKSNSNTIFIILHKNHFSKGRWSSPRPISISPLNTLLYLHSRPINLVFSKVSY